MKGWSSVPIVAGLAGAAVLMVAFFVVQSVRGDPMLPLGLFRNPSFTAAQVAAFAISGSFFYMTVYLQAIRHLTPISAGLVYLPSSAVLFLTSGASARLLRRVSPRTMISSGLAVVAAGMALCLLTSTCSSWLALFPGLLVASAGTGFFNPAVTAVALGEVPSGPTLSGPYVDEPFRLVRRIARTGPAAQPGQAGLDVTVATSLLRRRPDPTATLPALTASTVQFRRVR